MAKKKSVKKAKKTEDSKQVSKKTCNFADTLKNNYWAVSTVVLAIILLIVAVTPNTCTTGNTISGQEVGERVVAFANSQGAEAELIDVKDNGSIYEVTLSMQGQEFPIYATKDGENLIASLVPLEVEEEEETTTATSTTQTQFEKSDKPVVELFVMSYCPYGTQAEKGMIPVVELLGDKIDFRIRFVDYLMHGEKEAAENLREYCIQEEYTNEEYLAYMRCFLEGDGDDSSGYITNGNDVESCMAQTGIDSEKIETCVAEADEEYGISEALSSGASYPAFNVETGLNDQYGVAGSPTLVINGVQVSSSRDSVSYLTAVCSAFNEVPEECSSATLSSSTPSVYFGWDTSSSGSTTAQCG